MFLPSALKETRASSRVIRVFWTSKSINSICTNQERRIVYAQDACVLQNRARHETNGEYLGEQPIV